MLQHLDDAIASNINSTGSKLILLKSLKIKREI